MPPGVWVGVVCFFLLVQRWVKILSSMFVKVLSWCCSLLKVFHG